MGLADRGYDSLCMRFSHAGAFSFELEMYVTSPTEKESNDAPVHHEKMAY